MKYICDLCGGLHRSKVIIPSVGIAFGMGGYDYSFCKKCLSSMTAETFWKRIAKKNDLKWPLVRKEKA